MTARPMPRSAWLCLNSYGGRSQQVIEIIDETPKRFRIRALSRTRLAGRLRWLKAGETALVPKSAIREVSA